MTISDRIMVLAMIVAPILAIQIQKFIESLKEAKTRKMQIFRALMATRATPLSPVHVEALNMIDIEFYKSKSVVDAWKLLNDNFSNYPTDSKAKNFEVELLACNEKSLDLRINLLFEMAKVFGYNFDKVLLKRGCYSPKGHSDIESENNLMRRGIVNLLWGHSSLPVRVSEAMTQEKSAKDA